MSEPTAGTAGAPTTASAPPMPWYIPAFSPVLVRLLRAGLPLGFNGLITIRGRTSGQPRTVGVADHPAGRPTLRLGAVRRGELGQEPARGRSGDDHLSRRGRAGPRHRARPGAAPLVLPRHPRAARSIVAGRHDVHPADGQDRPARTPSKLPRVAWSSSCSRRPMVRPARRTRLRGRRARPPRSPPRRRMPRGRTA